MRTALILTGASRGIGRELARLFLEQEEGRLLTISRKPDASLEDDVKPGGADLEQMALDLADPVSAVSELEPVFSALAASACTRFVLVNNAGILDPIAPLGRLGAEAAMRNNTVNAAAPLVLMDLFIRYFGPLSADRRIINISSGAGRNAYPGWAAYCASKAALDMLSACLDAEQRGGNPVKVISFAPGVADTAMQDRIRAAAPEDFPPVERFLALKEDGALLPPRIPAEKILELIRTDAFPDEVIADIRTM